MSTPASLRAAVAGLMERAREDLAELVALRSVGCARRSPPPAWAT
jgi:hypothetical protein